MPSPCPICALTAAMQRRSLGMAMRLLTQAIALEPCCPCGARRGHAWQHPHGCAQSQCAGWRQGEEAPCHKA
jgi:hypothetical protein